MVSIHAPRAGCDISRKKSLITFKCFNSRTPCGVRLRLSRNIDITLCFNSRTPCGVRLHALQSLGNPRRFQFTHPVRGATSMVKYIIYRPSSFNSRTPCGVRLYRPRLNQPDCLFQFTHPVRGATPLSAPCRGRRGFNSRTPCGVRPQARSNQQWARMFQFTHPVRGATTQRQWRCHTNYVSIHAPRAGCDHQVPKHIQSHQQFQFTHPVRGATIISFQGHPKIGRFNSRTPCGVRLRDRHQIFDRTEFQFTHPVRGATSYNITRSFCVVFQFTHPVRGATLYSSVKRLNSKVSIHAPRAGCDQLCCHFVALLRWFQFTHPVRGATPSP